VTREAFENSMRGADLFRSGALSQELGLPNPDPEHDRVMLCGNPAMNQELRAFLEHQGWEMTDYKGVGNFTIEQAFVLSRED
jgi:ferredoxin--NADP+ reductase